MATQTKQLYEWGLFSSTPTKLLLLRDEHPVPLPPKAFETLLVLVQDNVQQSVQHSDTPILKDPT